MKKILPRGKYMLVRQAEEESRENENGLIIPASEEQERKSQGTVEAVSAEIKDVKKGDVVVFGAFAGETLKVKEGKKDVEFKLLHDDDVIAFIK
jgi:chaperonin GroES